MNIGIDAKALTVGTGIATYLSNICSQLQKIDNSNHYFLFTPRKINYKIVNPKWKIVYKKSLLPGTLWLIIQVPYLCKKYNADIFWGPEFFAPLSGMKKTQVVLTVHDLACILHPQYLSNIYLARFLNFLYPSLLKKSKLIITVSNFSKNQIAQVYGNKIAEKTHVIYNGAPDWQLPENYDSTNRNNELLFIGNQEPRKNLIGIIKSLSILKSSGKNLTLNVIGPKGWKSGEIFDYIQKYQLQIHFTGYVDIETIKKYLLTCKALLFPSLYEGFGVPVLEALKLDCIVITSENTVMEEIAGDSVILCDPYCPEDIAQKILGLFSPKFDRNKLLKNVQKTINKFKWELSTRKHLELFSNMYKQL